MSATEASASEATSTATESTARATKATELTTIGAVYLNGIRKTRYATADTVKGLADIGANVEATSS